MSALDLDIRSSSANVLDFSFVIDHSEVDLQSDNTVVETNLNRIGVLAFDVPETGPHFGLALGYAFGDFNNNPLFQPVDMDGWYIGVLARGLAYESKRLVVSLTGAYIYQDISGSNDVRETSLSWNEYSFDITVHVALTRALRFFTAAVYGDIDARYRERGANDQTVKMDSEKNLGFLAGLRYQLDQRESVSLQYQDHLSQGVVLNFRRLF